MRLYLDTANTQDWVQLLPLGVFYGITTNPILAQRAGLDYARSDWRGLLAHAKALGAKELHLQAFGDPSTYVKWAREIYGIAHQEEITAVIKIPLVRPAIAQVPDLKALGGKFLMTACYDAVQCLTAIALEADYLAPYLGRMQAKGIDALAHLNAMNMISRGSGCEVLAASIKSLEMLRQIAQAGTPCATLSPDLARALFDNSNSTEAHHAFEAACQSKK